MYFATYKKFGAYFFRFGKISQIFTFNMVKNKNFDPDHKSKIIHFFKNKQFCFYDLGQNFSFLTILKVKICDILPKQKKYAPNFLYDAKYMNMYQKINKKLEKCWGKS